MPKAFSLYYFGITHSPCFICPKNPISASADEPEKNSDEPEKNADEPERSADEPEKSAEVVVGETLPTDLTEAVTAAEGNPIDSTETPQVELETVKAPTSTDGTESQAVDDILVDEPALAAIDTSPDADEMKELDDAQSEIKLISDRVILASLEQDKSTDGTGDPVCERLIVAVFPFLQLILSYSAKTNSALLIVTFLIFSFLSNMISDCETRLM